MIKYLAPMLPTFFVLAFMLAMFVVYLYYFGPCCPKCGRRIGLKRIGRSYFPLPREPFDAEEQEYMCRCGTHFISIA